MFKTPYLSAKSLLITLIAATFIFVILIFVSAEPINLDLFQNRDCRVSCWNNLIVGKSTIDTVRSFMSSKYKDYQELDAAIIQGKGNTTNFEAQTTKGMSVYISVSEGLVDQIDLSADRFSYSLSDVIYQLGMTEYVHVRYTANIEGGFLGGSKEVIQGEVAFFYPNNGYIFYAPVRSQRLNNKVEICINENDLIDHITIVESGSIDSVFLNLSHSRTTIYFDDTLRRLIFDSLKPLPDFDCINLAYPPSWNISNFQSW